MFDSETAEGLRLFDAVADVACLLSAFEDEAKLLVREGIVLDVDGIAAFGNKGEFEVTAAEAADKLNCSATASSTLLSGPDTVSPPG